MVRLIPLIAALLFVFSASSCRSRCASDVDCLKACQCNGQTEWCQIGLLCENTFCEAEESIPCGVPGDTFCEKYGSSCGQRRCSSENDCRRTCECAAQGTVGNQPRTCCFRETLTSQCENQTRLCAADFARSCDEICSNDLIFSFEPTCQATDRRTNEAWTAFTCPVAPAPPQQ